MKNANAYQQTAVVATNTSRLICFAQVFPATAENQNDRVMRQFGVIISHYLGKYFAAIIL